MFSVPSNAVLNPGVLSCSEKESVGWNDGAWLFPRAVQLLNIERYRSQVLAGIVLSASTKTDSTVRYDRCS